MVRLCNNCGFENQDDYDFCAKCGTPLVEGARPKQIYVYKSSNNLPELNYRAVIISYIITIILSWSGFIFSFFSKNNIFAAFTFFGFFMPFYLVQSRHPKLRRHGLIQMVISLVGVALSFYVMLHK